MKLILRFILSLLLVFLFSTGVSAFASAISEANADCVMPSSSGDDQISASTVPFFPAAELSNGLSIPVHPVRVQRTLQSAYTLALKDLICRMTTYFNAAHQHVSRLLSSIPSHYCQPPSEYYVFTLRELLI